MSYEYVSNRPVCHLFSSVTCFRGRCMARTRRTTLCVVSSTASRTSCSDDGSELLTRSIRWLTSSTYRTFQVFPSGLHRKCGRSLRTETDARKEDSVIFVLECSVTRAPLLTATWNSGRLDGITGQATGIVPSKAAASRPRKTERSGANSRRSPQPQPSSTFPQAQREISSGGPVSGVLAGPTCTTDMTPSVTISSPVAFSALRGAFGRFTSA